MRITVIAFGTRGDVQPVLALCKRLQKNGHDIQILASSNFTAWIEAQGFQAIPARIDIQAMMSGEQGREWISQGNRPLQQIQVMKKLMDQYGYGMMEDAWAACRGAQVILSSFTSDVYAASIAEKLGAVQVSTPLQPAMVATRDGRATTAALRPGRVSIWNYWLGKVFIEPFAFRLMKNPLNQFRVNLLGLPAQEWSQARQALGKSLVVLGYSPAVVPHPVDWPPNLHTTGYWFLDEDPGWQPEPALAQFLEAGPAPVYVGFGSMAGGDPERLTSLILEAVHLAGVRAVIQAGWAGMGAKALPETVFLLKSASHRWLFPRMQAVVHHGGAGTTAESLRAGVPTVIVPHIADQPFWGQRVFALGAGPRAIPRDRLTTASLAEAIRLACSSETMRTQAQAIGEIIRAEDGLGNAVQVIEAFLRESSLPH